MKIDADINSIGNYVDRCERSGLVGPYEPERQAIRIGAIMCAEACKKLTDEMQRNLLARKPPDFWRTTRFNAKA